MKNNSPSTSNNNQSNITGDLIAKQLTDPMRNDSFIQRKVMENNYYDVVNNINILDAVLHFNGGAIDID